MVLELDHYGLHLTSKCMLRNCIMVDQCVTELLRSLMACDHIVTILHNKSRSKLCSLIFVGIWLHNSGKETKKKKLHAFMYADCGAGLIN